MDPQTLIYLFVGLTFAVYTGIAWWSKASSAKDFYVAGSGVSPLANGMATAADFMSVAAMLSVPGIVAMHGFDTIIYLIGPPGGFLLLGILVAPYLRKFGKFTVPDFIGERYYSNAARSIAVVCALCVSLMYLAGQMRGVGVVFSRFLNVPIAQGVIIGAAVVLVYAILGGMKGITYTQVAQFCVLTFAFLTPVIFLSIMLTDHMVPSFGMGAKVLGTDTYMLDKLDGLHREFGFKAFTEQGKSTLQIVAVGLTLMLGTAGMPHIIIRYFTVPNVRDARKSIFYTLLFIGLVFICTPPLAVFARTLLVDTLNGMSYANTPQWFQTWETLELIQFNDLNGDGIVNYISGPQNELKIDNDIMTLAMPEIAKMPNWIIALFAAGALAAALSTAAGLLLVVSTSVSHDLIKEQFAPNISEKKELLIARTCMAFAVLIGIYFGINPPDFIIKTVILAFMIAASTLFPAIILGIFTKKINREGAIAGMLVGLVISISYIAYFVFLGGTADGYWFGISPQGFAIISVPIHVAVASLVSSFTNGTPEKVKELVEHVRNPLGAGEALDH